ncbi:unnamed protein product [Closterium sp. NIES-65]|nr:unnamed protein product [Closterium sp. NIES-65]
MVSRGRSHMVSRGGATWYQEGGATWYQEGGATWYQEGGATWYQEGGATWYQEGGATWYQEGGATWYQEGGATWYQEGGATWYQEGGATWYQEGGATWYQEGGATWYQEEEPHGIKREEPHGIKREEPHGIKREEPHGIKREEPHGIKREEPHGIKREEPYGIKREEPHGIKREEPHGIKREGATWYQEGGATWYQEGGATWYQEGGATWYQEGGAIWYQEGGATWYQEGWTVFKARLTQSGWMEDNTPILSLGPQGGWRGQRPTALVNALVFINSLTHSPCHSPSAILPPTRQIGSTEWVEDNAPLLSSRAVAYINVDTAVSGAGFHAAATPQLDDVIREVAELATHHAPSSWEVTPCLCIAQVEDPDKQGQSVYASWAERTNRTVPYSAGSGLWWVLILSCVSSPVGYLLFLPSPRFCAVHRIVLLGGGGSDYAPFLQHLGIAAADLHFGEDYPMYHSLYDSYHCMTTVLDPRSHHPSHHPPLPSRLPMYHSLYDNYHYMTTVPGPSLFTSPYPSQPTPTPPDYPMYHSLLPMYHSLYDNYHYMTTVLDPLFARHRASAQLWGALTLRLAGDAALPFNFSTYALRLKVRVRSPFTRHRATAQLWGSLVTFQSTQKSLCATAQLWESLALRLAGDAALPFNYSTYALRLKTSQNPALMHPSHPAFTPPSAFPRITPTSWRPRYLRRLKNPSQPAFTPPSFPQDYTNELQASLQSHAAQQHVSLDAIWNAIGQLETAVTEITNQRAEAIAAGEAAGEAVGEAAGEAAGEAVGEAAGEAAGEAVGEGKRAGGVESGVGGGGGEGEGGVALAQRRLMSVSPSVHLDMPLPLLLRDINDRLMLAERGFLEAAGLGPGYTWYRHMVSMWSGDEG